MYISYFILNLNEMENLVGIVYTSQLCYILQKARPWKQLYVLCTQLIKLVLSCIVWYNIVTCLQISTVHKF